MVEDFKSLKDSLLKGVFSAVASASESGGSSESKGSASVIKDLIGSLASIAGKGKDEIVQIISREIGIAVAGVVREPLTQILKEKKVKITIEFVPRTDERKPQGEKTSKAKASKKTAS